MDDSFLFQPGGHLVLGFAILALTVLVPLALAAVAGAIMGRSTSRPAVAVDRVLIPSDRFPGLRSSPGRSGDD